MLLGLRAIIKEEEEKVKYWRCAQNGCSVRPGSRISTSQLVGENQPEHDHTTNLMKRKAKEVEMVTIKRFASVPGRKNEVYAW
jgi:hypothetical protein